MQEHHNLEIHPLKMQNLTEGEADFRHVGPQNSASAVWNLRKEEKFVCNKLNTVSICLSQ